jgi:hypothetical protein
VNAGISIVFATAGKQIRKYYFPPQFSHEQKRKEQFTVGS